MLKISSFNECKVVGDLFTTGIPEIDNDTHIQKLKENIFKSKKITNKKSIYIVKFRDGTIKIGVSKNPQRRIKTIERNSGRIAIESFISKEVENSFEIEMKIKNRFKGNNIKGEFYNQDYNEVLNFTKELLKRREQNE